MINQHTAAKLLSRLPLLTNEISKENSIILFHKWGGADGKYHSSKNVIKSLKIEDKTLRELVYSG